MNDAGRGRRDDTGERSDLFSLGRSVEQIPDVEEVLLPPEEQRRLKLRRLGAVAAAAAALVVLLVLAYRFVHARTLEEAVLAAGDGGRMDALDRARTLASEDGLDLLAARLDATRALEGGDADLDAVAAAVAAAADASGDELLEGRLAETYLALARFDGQAALRAEGTLRAVGTYAAEVAHAKAATGLAVGDLDHARSMIAVALERAPGGARHQALALSIQARSDPAAALAAAQALPAPIRDSPALRALSARLSLQLGALGDATRDARAVLADDTATPRERSWAALVAARVRLEAGDAAGARSEAAPLLDRLPKGDEALRLALAELLCLTGDATGAQRARAGLPSGYSTDPPWRARVDALAAITSGDAAAARTALAGAGSGPESSWLSGRLAELEGRTDDARSAYAAATADAAIGPTASLALSRLELAAGRAEAAVEAIRALAERDPTHPARAFALAEGLTRCGHAAEAATVAQRALAAHEGDASLLTALGHAQAAQGDHGAARASLARAVEARSDDAELQADLAVEARLSGNNEESRRAAEAALAIDASHVRALTSLFTLELDENHLEAAHALLERLDAADARGLELDRERARYWVASGSGLAGVRPVRRAIRRHGRDAELRLRLGDLYLQAEMWAPALNAFGAAERLGAAPLDAQVGAGLAQIGMRRLPPAQATLERVKEMDGASESPRVAVLESTIELFQRHIRPARQAAERALSLNPHDAEAHLLLGKLRRISGGDVVQELRAALTSPGTPPDALARLARTLGSNEEGCDLARRFRRAAPAGDGARDMRTLLRDCPR